MHKVNEISQDLIRSWKKGWNDYVVLPGRDEKPILDLARECAKILKVDLDEQKGFLRVMEALEKIGKFCGSDKNWWDKNLFTINQCLSTIMQEMQAKKKSQKAAEYDLTAADRLYGQQKTERRRAEEEMRKESDRLKIEHEANWTDEDEAGYQKYMKSLQPGRVIPIGIMQDPEISKIAK